MMTQSLLNQASAWGFVCKRESSGHWKILPHPKAGRWELQQVEDRWLLLIGGVAQVNLLSVEALQFLKRRWSNSSRREAV
jgi:hypothetical protein